MLFETSRGTVDTVCGMHALTIQARGRPVAPNIKYVTDWPDPPPPAPGEAQVRVLCSALNHLDLSVGVGLPGVTQFPRISGCDLCGDVDAVGEGVDPAWVGRRVIMNAAMDRTPLPRADEPPRTTLAPQNELIGEHTNGAHCQRLNLPVAHLQAIGDDADPAAAAAFGLVTLTAYSMLVTKAQARAGQIVLITGIGGGVALATLALAKHVGCRTVVTSRSREKLDRAAALGADHGVLDDGGDFSKPLRAWTNKRGVDIAVDSVGKATHLNCIKSLARGGAYVTCGATTGPDATTDLARIFWNQLRIIGSTMGTNEELAEVAALFRAGKVGAVVDTIVPAPQGAEAFARLERGEQFGKVVIDWREI